MTVCCLGRFDEVLGELLECLHESGLYAKSRSIELSVLGEATARAAVARTIAAFPKIRIGHTSDNLLEYEFPALALLQETCNRTDGVVYYLHTKGVSHDPSDQFQRHWRALMLHHVVEQNEHCLEALETHDCVGTVWKGNHYSGNFWWARAEHIRRLPDITTLRETPRNIAWEAAMNVRVQCEYWIGMSPGRFKSVGPEAVHLYDVVRWTHSAEQIVGWLLEATGGSRYLELGMAGPGHHVSAPLRHVVSLDERAEFRMSELEFFDGGLGEPVYDLVFIDTVHEAERCLRAIDWALARLSERGVIVVHDSNPPSAWHQRPRAQYEWGSEWNGDVWKAVVSFRQRHPELSVVTVNTDWGCTIIRPWARARQPFDTAAVGELSWDRFHQNRDAWLDLISVRRLRRDLVHVPFLLGRAGLASQADLVNVLLSRFGLDRYLELGAEDPARIIAPIRQTVAPNPGATFDMTAGEFFAARVGCPEYDLIVAGERDVDDAVERLAPRGFLVIPEDSRPRPPGTAIADLGCTLICGPEAIPNRDVWPNRISTAELRTLLE